MTCIIGIEHRKKVYIGADSGIVQGYNSSITRAPKIFKLKSILFGTCGNIRVSQLIQHMLSIPQDKRKNDPLKYMILDLVPRIRKMLDKEGCLGEEGFESELIVGYKGQLFKIDPFFQVVTYDRGYVTTGVGENIALGVLATTTSLSPEKRIMKALEIVSSFEKIIIPPYIIQSI